MSDCIYGRRPVWEALRAGKRAFHKLWLEDGSRGERMEEVLRLARQRGVGVTWTSRSHLDRMASGGHHQGMAIQVNAASYGELNDFLRELKPGEPALVVALDEIRDPQNTGAILRNAAFFGVNAALFPRWRSAPVSSAAVRASAGAAEHVRLLQAGNLVGALEDLKGAGFEVIGADASGGPVWQYRRGARVALVVGNEDKGLRRLVRERCDRLIGIPPPSAIGSLNAASATAILLYELSRPVGSGPA